MSAAPAWAGDFALSASDPVVLLVTGGTVSLAIAAGLWALAQQRVTRRLQRQLQSVGARTRALIGERDALLGTAREALIVWGRDGRGTLSFSGAEKLLDECLKGAEATELSTAIDALSDQGTAFAMTAHDEGRRRIKLRGQAVGGMAAVWLETETALTLETLDYRLILDMLPTPVWLRDRAQKLIWGNRTFLSATGASDIDAAVLEQMALDKGERDLAIQAYTQNQVQTAERRTVIGGQQRALMLTEVPVDLGVVGTASDVTEVAASAARLQQHIAAHSDTLDKLATAVAIFDADQHISFFNRAFAKLWDIPAVWLDTHPSDSEILDRLREERKLPEQRDYQSWKAERLKIFQTAHDYAAEELWHTPDGRNLRVMVQPHPFGGLTFLFEDVTERISLESSINTLGKVQSATLDSLREGVAVFGPDGRLKLHNAAFAEIWGLTEKDLTSEPHIRAIAAACATKFATEPMWEQLIQAVVSEDGGSNDFGEIERTDRTILSLRLSQLPDGAKLITFADATARIRIEGVLRERAEALEAADRLKSDFIKHVSYELRTPLNTILGFAEHLSSEVPGALNERQREYMQAIVSSSNALKDLVNDILDLALVESGALRLELARIDLTQLLTDIAAHAREWAAKAGLTLELEAPDPAGDFFADERRISQVIYNLLSNAIKY
ncbi:MAG: PAS-domain containing protein, partial [Rhizomicrobium sp.]